MTDIPSRDEESRVSTDDRPTLKEYIDQEINRGIKEGLEPVSRRGPMTVKKRFVTDMTVDELLDIYTMCTVCIGTSPSWDGHSQNPPCKGAAHDEIVRRARLTSGRSSERGPIDRVTLDPEVTREKMKNPDSLDEIVVSNCMIHLERMDDSWYYLGVYDNSGLPDDLMLQVSIRAKSKKRVTATVYHATGTAGIGGDAL